MSSKMLVAYYLRQELLRYPQEMKTQEMKKSEDKHNKPSTMSFNIPVHFYATKNKIKQIFPILMRRHHSKI